MDDQENTEYVRKKEGQNGIWRNVIREKEEEWE